MKKVIWFLVIVLILMSFFILSCGQPSPTPSKPTTTQTPSTSKPSITTTQPTSLATSPAAADVIKIGHIRPLTGNMATTSNFMVKAFDWAFEQIGYQVAGKRIQIIVGDTKGDPGTGIDVARKMVESDHVALVVGPLTSGEVVAAAGYMNQAGIPQVITNPASTNLLSGHKWTILKGGSEVQYSSAMGVYAYDQLGYRKVNILTEDNSDGHAFIDAFMNAFKKKGGQIVQEQYPPYPCQDFATYLTVLKPADALIAWFDGAQSIKFLTQYYEMGINKKLPLVGDFYGSFIEPFVYHNLAPQISDAALGNLIPTNYALKLDTAFNKKWVADYQAKFGGLPAGPDAGPYQGAMLVINALKSTNGDTTPDKLRQALLAQTFEGPEGPTKFDQQTGCALVNVYICKIDKQGNDFFYSPLYTFKEVPPLGF